MRVMRPPYFLLCAASVLTVAGCATFPELDQTISPEGEAAPPPELAPLDPLIVPAAASRGSVGAIEDASAALQGRASETRLRADEVEQAEGIDAATREAILQRRADLAAQREAIAE